MAKKKRNLVLAGTRAEYETYVTESRDFNSIRLACPADIVRTVNGIPEAYRLLLVGTWRELRRAQEIEDWARAAKMRVKNLSETRVKGVHMARLPTGVEQVNHRGLRIVRDGLIYEILGRAEGFDGYHARQIVNGEPVTHVQIFISFQDLLGSQVLNESETRNASYQAQRYNGSLFRVPDAVLRNSPSPLFDTGFASAEAMSSTSSQSISRVDSTLTATQIQFRENFERLRLEREGSRAGVAERQSLPEIQDAERYRAIELNPRLRMELNPRLRDRVGGGRDLTEGDVYRQFLEAIGAGAIGPRPVPATPAPEPVAVCEIDPKRKRKITLV